VKSLWVKKIVGEKSMGEKFEDKVYW
jgi:hypothetical protein